VKKAMIDIRDQVDEKYRDRLQKASFPVWSEPMLATLTDDYFADPGWIYERKLNDERYLVYYRKKKQSCCLVTDRNWTTKLRLRHPRFIGLRWDKKSKEVVREEADDL
jgi:hypothetical protein